MNSRAAIGYVSANESTGSTGTSACKGMERIAREDELRSLWLDEQLVLERIETRRVKAKMRMSTYRRRKTLVPA
jgi:hypothetical protein